MKTEDYGQYLAANEVRFVRLLPGPIDRVWAYIVEPEKRATWFAGGPIDLKVGGRAHFQFNHSVFDSGESQPEGCDCSGEGMKGTVLAIDPPRLITFTFPEDGPNDEGNVTIELSERGKEVQLTLTHRRIATQGATLGVSSGWHCHLDIMVAKIAGKPLPLFWSKMRALKPEYTQQYAKQFPV
jgi:uncharacterized protein YndB with AHSA1/START domain